MATLTDEEFLAECEELFKDRYTEKDDEFMKVFNAKPSTPPIIENRQRSHNFRLDGRHNRRYTPYNRDRHNRDRGYQDRGSRDNYGRGYQDGRSREDNRHGYPNPGREDSRSEHQDPGGRDNYRRGYSDYDQDDRVQGNRYGQRHY